MANLGPKYLNNRPKGRGSPRLPTTAPMDRHARIRRVTRQFVAQPALADPGLTFEKDHLPLSRLSPTQGRLQLRKLLLTPHERR